MGTSNSYSDPPPLNPAAPVFAMPAQAISTANAVPASPTSQSLSNGFPKTHKRQKSTQGNDISSPGPKGLAMATVDESKLSGAELKKQKAAEKSARRKEKITEKGSSDAAVFSSLPQKSGLERRPSAGKKDIETVAHHKRTGSTSTRLLPVRAAVPATQPEPEKKLKDEKKVAIFSHLYSKDRRANIAGAGKEIHPAVLSLGLQLRDHVICGSNARCVAMLLVFKKIIRAYTTPTGVALSRHLTTHLSHQISYLTHSRPLSVGQGNSIRWLKKLISGLDPDLSDNDAITFLCSSIDGFIREKITLADELIAKEASSKIVDGDVILTYAKSSVVEKTLLAAHQQRKRFKVVVVDSRPLFEGQNLARSLSAAGIQTQYCLISGLASAVDQATKCLLGASAMMGNGRLYSRAGTALVAMMAKDGNGLATIGGNALSAPGSAEHRLPVGIGVPVIVLCETVKFSGRATLDSIVGNELGDPNALVEMEESSILTAANSSAAANLAKAGKKGNKGGTEEDDPTDALKQKRGLDGWAEQTGLHLLNLMYDVTPAEYLDMIITELGNLPPSAVPVVNGVWGGET